MRHIALIVLDMEASLRFYRDLLGLAVEWHPDADNVYLTSGHDNVALHKAPVGFKMASHQRLDHLGFILESEEEVDSWYTFLKENGVVIKNQPRTHRDGARSFYCEDPDGNVVQMIYHPPLVKR
jgi:catechol 2,3-dioxygenase-like lactoylglutathione lyase family enzyme